MRKLVEFALDHEDHILVEVDVRDFQEGLSQASRSSEIALKAVMTFEKAMNVVKPAAQSIIGQIRQLSDSPDEVEIEFGLKLSAEAGAYVAAASAEANYKVTLSWKRASDEAGSKS